MNAHTAGQLVQAGRDEYLYDAMALGGVAGAGVQEPSHFVNVIHHTVMLEDFTWGMPPLSGIYPSSGEDAGTGSVADTNTLGPQAPSPPVLQTQPHINVVGVFAPGAQQLTTIPQYVFPRGSSIGQRQQPILRDDAQAPIAGGSVFGANRTADPITPGAFGGIVDNGWTGTLCWRHERDGPLSHVQAVATDGVRNPCVYSFVRCKPIEYSNLRRMFSIWPTLLQIQFTETVIPFLDIQAWLLKTRAPVARIKGKSGDSHQFDDLVELVRSSGSVSRRSRLPTYPPYTLIVRTGGLGEGTTAIPPRAARRGPIVHVLPLRLREPTKTPAAAARPKEAPCALELHGALQTRLSTQSCGLGHPYAQKTITCQGDTECANSAAG